MERRELLRRGGTLGVVSLAGCLGMIGPRLRVENERETAVPVDISITRTSDGRVILQTSRTIDPANSATTPIPMEAAGSFRFQVRGSDSAFAGSLTTSLAPDEEVRVVATVSTDGVHFSTEPSE